MLRGPQNLGRNLEIVRGRIARAAARAGRNADSITLVGASKSQPLTAIAAAARAGLADFGESYVQEALGKLAALGEPAHRDLPPLRWHFIGRMQANKTRPVAEHFSWVHAVDRLKIAERLSAQRPYHSPPLNVCIEVNLGAEIDKGGAAAAEVEALAASIATLPRLKLRGLMCLPPEEPDETAQRRWFAELRRLFERLNAQGAGLDTLSMGMTGDLEAAVLEGATVVRVGTGIFGPRPPPRRPDTIAP
ncbi:MAG TPA: YggS family pyridoxal phosphate-dependent enzyme [Steroidobacteraceae bacterium]|nr:YggS family pyridoxal phosphate-dependent enzyme [Steroidobacteraceae bacterium]